MLYWVGRANITRPNPIFIKGDDFMKEEPSMRLQESGDEENDPPAMGNHGGFDRKKIPLAIVGIVVVLALLGGAVYFFTSGGSPAREEERLLQPKMLALEQKISALEKQIEELAVKMAPSGPQPDIAQRMNELSQRLDSLEKRGPAAPEKKVKPAASPKPAAAKPVVSTPKQYHTVQKGETLTSISKKHKIGVAELRKLNNLSDKQAIFPGQKLVIAQGR
jgi:LysM repeat protein